MDLNLAISIFALMAVGNYWVARSVLYPPFIFCIMFLLDLGIYRGGFIEIDPLHGNTLLFIVGGGLVFSLGGLLSRGIPERFMAVRFPIVSGEKRSQAPKYAILGLLLLSIPLILHERNQKAAQGTGDSYIERARNATNDQTTDGRNGADYIVNSIGPSATMMTLVFMVEGLDWVFWSCLGFVVFTALVGGGRSGILQLLSAIIGIRLISTRRESFGKAIKSIGLPSLVFAVFFIAFIYVSKDTSAYEGLGGVISFFLVGYIISPITALDHVVQHPGDFITSNHSLQFFLRPVSALGLVPYTPPPVFDHFIFVPMPTNVYTAFRFYFTDFGFAGALICLGIIGMLHSILYRRAQMKNSKLALVMFGFSLFSVIMAIFDDLYFQVGAYVRLTVLYLIYWFLSSLKWRWLPQRLTIDASHGE